MVSTCACSVMEWQQNGQSARAGEACISLNEGRRLGVNTSEGGQYRGGEAVQRQGRGGSKLAGESGRPNEEQPGEQGDGRRRQEGHKGRGHQGGTLHSTFHSLLRPAPPTSTSRGMEKARALPPPV